MVRLFRFVAHGASALSSSFPDRGAVGGRSPEAACAAEQLPETVDPTISEQGDDVLAEPFAAVFEEVVGERGGVGRAVLELAGRQKCGELHDRSSSDRRHRAEHALPLAGWVTQGAGVGLAHTFHRPLPAVSATGILHPEERPGR